MQKFLACNLESEKPQTMASQNEKYCFKTVNSENSLFF
jgi:hypothetical protein